MARLLMIKCEKNINEEKVLVLIDFLQYFEQFFSHFCA